MKEFYGRNMINGKIINSLLNMSDVYSLLNDKIKTINLIKESYQMI